jgi:hypothetical protein
MREIRNIRYNSENIKLMNHVKDAITKLEYSVKMNTECEALGQD